MLARLSFLLSSNRNRGGAIVAYWCLAVFLALWPSLQATRAADPSWPQILGPQRNGVSSEAGLMDAWPKNGLPEVWRVSGGVGMSGLVLQQGRLITMLQDADGQAVVARNAQTGEPVWRTVVAPEYKNAMGNGPRATPTIAGETVVAFSGEGVLTALNFSDGKMLWSHNVVKNLNGKPAEYGMACSPLVVGERIIVTLGAPRAAVAAFDLKSGAAVWTVGHDLTGYSSPALLRVGGREQVVAYTGGSVLGIDPQSGKLLWRYPYTTDYACNIATPISYEGRVFISSGESHGCVMLSLTKNGSGFDVQETWASLGVKSVMRNEWQTSVLMNGYLYGMDNVGSAGIITHLTCVSAANGKRAWRKTRFGKGNLIGADGKLFISTMKGELVVVRATPNGFTELGREEVIGSTRQAPTLAGGLLYLRDDREIVCFDVRKK